MEINEIRILQENFDKEHGWVVKTGDISELIGIISKDLVGLMGEIGEFANIVKKITLVKDSSGSVKGEKIFEELKDQLSEELIDAFIYILRMATHLKMDLEKKYLNKLEYNRKKYEDYET